jgi:predicted metal-dependent hydrolase
VVQLGLPFLRADPSFSTPTINFVRARRARRYIIRVTPDGSFRITIPRGGSRSEAEAFLQAHRAWAEGERVRVLAEHAPGQWVEGDEILMRGELVPLRITREGGVTWLRIATHRIELDDGSADLRPSAERCLRAIAQRELTPRLLELAGAHSLKVARISIRNQRSRWGSCSPNGAIALNFRLVQAPDAIRDYVLIHELMHLKQQNHSRRFWRLVEEACPDFRVAERWLRTTGRSLF